MAFQALIGIHFQNKIVDTLESYLRENNLVLEKIGNEERIRRKGDNQGSRRYCILRRNEGHKELFNLYVGSVVDAEATDLEKERQSVEKDLPGSIIHLW